MVAEGVGRGQPLDQAHDVAISSRPDRDVSTYNGIRMGLRAKKGGRQWRGTIVAPRRGRDLWALDPKWCDKLNPRIGSSPYNEWPFGTAVAGSDSTISGGALRHIDGTILGVSPLGSTRCSRGSWHADIVGFGVNTNQSLFRFFADNSCCRRTASSGPNDPNVGHSHAKPHQS
jgi:hypothetical protein